MSDCRDFKTGFSFVVFGSIQSVQSNSNLWVYLPDFGNLYFDFGINP
jgi:hypothetical protein